MGEEDGQFQDGDQKTTEVDKKCGPQGIFSFYRWPFGLLKTGMCSSHFIYTRLLTGKDGCG